MTPWADFERLRRVQSPGGFTRDFERAAGNNRLAVVHGSVDVAYATDNNGNIAREATSRHFEWDHAGRLKGFRVQPVGGPASVVALSLYDREGNRVKKLVRKQGVIESTVWAGDFAHAARRVGGALQADEWLRIDDDGRLLAELRFGPALGTDPASRSLFISPTTRAVA